MSSSSIRIAIGQFRDLTDEKLRFGAQMGVTSIQMNKPNIPGETFWEETDLRALVEKAASFDMRIESIENVPSRFYDKVLLGLPGRDAQIENYRRTIRAIGRAGIPILGYHFMPNYVWRTARAAPGRGGAQCTAFDMAVVNGTRGEANFRAFLPPALAADPVIPFREAPDEIIDEASMWSNYEYFIDAVLPVAEEEGVKLALHPDDPPVPMLAGVARLFWKPENFIRAWKRNPDSPSWGLNLCLGCCSEMVGGAANIRRMIEFFGPKGRIFYVHFRDVQGTVPKFQECFLGEGNFDPAEVMALLRREGFDGFLLDDHVPHMDGDTEWNHRGRAHAIGYMQGLLRMAAHTSA